jgi:hypothetical protein
MLVNGELLVPLYGPVKNQNGEGGLRYFFTVEIKKTKTKPIGLLIAFSSSDQLFYRPTSPFEL